MLQYNFMNYQSQKKHMSECPKKMSFPEQANTFNPVIEML